MMQKHELGADDINKIGIKAQELSVQIHKQISMIDDIRMIDKVVLFVLVAKLLTENTRTMYTKSDGGNEFSDIEKAVDDIYRKCFKLDPKVVAQTEAVRKSLEEKKVLHAKAMAKRMEVPGFKREFNAGFVKLAAQHPMGTVDTEKLSRDILEKMGVADPAIELESASKIGS